MRSLPGESILIFNDKNKSSFIENSDSLQFDFKLINMVRKTNAYYGFRNGKQVVGINYQDNQGDFVIIASAYDVNGMHNLNELKKVLLIGFLLSLVVVFFVGKYFSNLIFNPISEITAQAKRISETNLHLRLNERNKKDELAELSITINRMLARLENAFELQTNFVANASHELRTPLTSIIGNIEVALTRKRSIEDHETLLSSILEQAEKLHKLTNGLLHLAQSNLEFSSTRKQDIRVDELLLEVKDEIQVKRPGSEVEIIFPEMPLNSDRFLISGDKHLLETALLNLVDNACKFSDRKKVSVTLFFEENNIGIKVIDYGIGIHTVDLPHIFETFYRAQNAHNYAGSGIGLSLTRKIVSLHNGKIQVFSKINVGTEVLLLLPVS